MPTTIGEAFSLARIVDAHFEDERSTIAIAKPNKFTTRGCNIYEGCCQLDIQFLNLKELQENQEEHNCYYYYWKNCFLILNAEEYDNTKPPLSADTFGNNGGDGSETSGLETLAKEVVDNGNGSALIFMVEYDTESEVVTGLLEEF
ncbi:hypothetical protein Tco_1074943 [Tanacetum coccineum]